ncbi:MAG: hypothetical protein OXH22_08440 [Chloroflexi bacterium]|nr:hypothetical protein [Chloroflexota bacterium]
MAKVNYRTETFGEDDRYVCMCPELGISRTGRTSDDAIEWLRESVDTYLQGCDGEGVLEAVLEEAGFEKSGDAWELAKRAAEKRVALTGAEHRANLEDTYSPDNHPRDKKSYTITMKGGHTATVTRLSKEDVERKLAKFEAKYGMTSKEFIVKYHSCGFEEENLEFMDWEWYYYAACEGKYSWEGE